MTLAALGLTAIPAVAALRRWTLLRATGTAVCLIATAYAAINAYATSQSAKIGAVEAAARYSDARGQIEAARAYAEQARAEIGQIAEKISSADCDPVGQTRTRKNGQVVYDLRDGGQVIDRSEGLWVQVNTPHAIFLTLCLQRERSPGRSVKLGGDAAFQRQMIEMAAAKRMDLTFADLHLERQRCELMGLPVPPLPELPAPPPSLASTARKLLAQLGQALIGGGKARRT